MKIEVLAEAGVYQKDIAEQLEISARTVARALARGSAPERKSWRKGQSKLDPYKSEVDRLLGCGVRNGTVILRELQALGYEGGRTLVREYIKPKRALLPGGKATVRFETSPGQQLQSDWGEIRTRVNAREQRVCFIVNTLGWSRRMHVWCTDSQDAEHTYEGLIQTLEYFGGVPREVLVDNQKAAVLEHAHGESPRFNARFVDLAACYGFVPRACRPYRARTKGKDERMVGYCKQHFFERYQSFGSWAHLNQQMQLWLRDEADQRMHGTTHETPAARFDRERGQLQPLPGQRFDTSYAFTRRVASDGYVDVQGNRFSVPCELIGHTLLVRLDLQGNLRIFSDELCVARHRWRPAEAGWCRIDAHHAALWTHAMQSQATQVQRRSLAAYEALLP